MCVLCDAGFCDEHVKVDVAIQADIVGPPPPPSSTEAAIQVTPSLHSSSSQTNPPPLLVNTEAQAQPMDSTPAPTTASTLDPPAFNWSEDAASIPITPIFPKNQPSCDLSALCTSNSNPFSSLACRNCRSQLPLDNCDISGSQPPFQPRWAPPFFPVSKTIPHQCFIQVSNPTPPPLPLTPFKIPMALDWESDPLLSDLSWALKALGWIHQWSFLCFYINHSLIFPYHFIQFLISTLHFFFSPLRFLFQQLEARMPP